MAKTNREPRALRKSVRWLPIAGMLALTLAMTMPSCPGQQAMQQQIDALQSSNNRLNSQLMSMDSQLRAISADNANLKQAMQGMAQAVDGQKATIDQLSGAMKDLQQKFALAAARMAPPKKSAHYKRHRH